jgi:acetamidase/formamidase
MPLMRHHIPLERRSVHGHFSPSLAPVVTIDPGDSVHFSALNALWQWDLGQDWSHELDPELDSGHPLAGPVAVRGVVAGETLVVRTDRLLPRDWGVTLAAGEPDVEVYWRLDTDAGTATADSGQTVAMAPFLGVIGMPPPGPGVHSTIPPRRFGGNIDCRELTAGSTLYLPVGVDGGLLSAGDAHAAQGDGEVSGTAIECPLELAELTIDVRRDLDLRMPVARSGDRWIALGFDEDLDRAAELALETMLDLMQHELGLDRTRALALASVAVDLRVTQLVNQVKGVHAVLADNALS